MDLQTLWFAAVAVLWTGFLLLEGFDFGVAALLPVLGRRTADRHLMLRTLGPLCVGAGLIADDPQLGHTVLEHRVGAVGDAVLDGVVEALELGFPLSRTLRNSAICAVWRSARSFRRSSTDDRIRRRSACRRGRPL